MKKLLLIALISILINKVQAQELTSGGKLKPEQAIMDVRHYTIALALNFSQKSIDGYTTIDVIMARPSNVLIFDLLDSLNVRSVLVNNQVQPFTYNHNLITIHTSKELPAGKASVKVIYNGKPHIARRPPWDDGFIWTTDSTGHPWMAITAEGTGGKLYFPCKDHPSDEPNEGVDMFITVPKGLVVAGPGLLKQVTTKATQATYHWKTNYTINNYSIVFNVGDYKVESRTYTTIEGHRVPLQFYVLNEHAAKAPHHLDVFERTIHEQEKYFGEYPWVKEKIGIVETPHLGMEHETMNAYGNKFRYTKVGGQDYDGLMHHEFGHEWWGNKVTAKDWADYWIHEGICSFGDALFVREYEGEDAYVQYFKQSKFGIKNDKPIVQGKDLDEESAYIGDIYSKGAFFMHTLRYIIGDSVFFSTFKKLATAPQYTYSNMVNTDDVEQLFSQATGRNLKPIFDLYLRTTNKLEINVKALRSNKYLIQFNNMTIPLPIDITVNGTVSKRIVDQKGIVIASDRVPVIDANDFYLKKVIIE